jgi:hypothetical protein
VALALTILVALVLAGWPPSAAPEVGGGSTLPGAPSPAPTAAVRCAEEPDPLPPELTGLACPWAIPAVELAVAPVRLPIERIVIEPGPFYCDVLWPGVQTPATCYGYAVRPGQFMHAWVRFRGSTKVAAVMLGLDLSPDGASAATRPPWHTTLVAVETPPDGWVMP